MKILVIGSGGREHALIDALGRSENVSTIYCTPGNAGIASQADIINVAADDFAAIAQFCKDNDVDLVVPGPEAPLVEGITDALEAEGILVFGPSKAASALEGSKDFTKKLCDTYNIPTAAYGTFTDAESAIAYIKAQDTRIVVKADGLAAGKGVILPESEAEAIAAVTEMFDGKFGDAGKKVVIEEFLEGEEASLFAISDGHHAIPFGSAQDHKRVGEGDTGPNTGGMGTYSPAPVATPELEARAFREIIEPLVEGMKEDGVPFKGVIFAGLMIDASGAPKLIEINIRFGDPEAQVLMLRLESDLAALMLAAAKGSADGMQVSLSPKTALCVVMAAKGYPEAYEKNTEITLSSTPTPQGITIFHAGTKVENGKLLSIGGRVLGVTALGDDVIEAQTKAYEAVDAITWDDGFCRRDIGWRAIKRITLAS